MCHVLLGWGLISDPSTFENVWREPNELLIDSHDLTSSLKVKLSHLGLAAREMNEDVLTVDLVIYHSNLNSY